MKTNFGTEGSKRPYEKPTFKSYGKITGVTQQIGSGPGGPLDDASNDGGTPGGVIDPNDPTADTHNSNFQISD